MSGFGRLGRRNGGWRRWLSPVVVTASAAAACTGGPIDDGTSVDQLRSAPFIVANPSGGSERDEGAGGAAGPPLVPGRTFQRLDPARFADASPAIAVSDAVPHPDGGWLVVGGLEDGRQRRLEAVVVLVDPDRPDLTKRIVLPTGDAEQAMATGVLADSDDVTVAGWVAFEDRTSAVVWTSGTALSAWTMTELPSTGSTGERADSVVGPLGRRYVVGSTRLDGFEQPLAWRSDGGGWRPLPVAQGPTIAVEADLTITGATVTERGIVAVGRSATIGDDPKPVVWAEDGGELVVTAGRGLPSRGALSDVAVATDGSLVAVGGSTENGVATPLVATATTLDGRWAIRSAEVDIAGWVSFDGLSFDRLLVEGEDLYATLIDPVVQQLSRSSDGGRTWTRIGDIGAVSGNFAPGNALARDDRGRLLVAGGDVLLQHPGDAADGRWKAVAAPRAIPSQLGAFEAVDVVATDRGWFIGGGRMVRTGAGAAHQAVLWQSRNGTDWGRPPIDDPDGYLVHDLVASADGGVAALTAGGGYFTGVRLARPDPGGRWLSVPLPVGEAVLDHSLWSPAGVIVAAGTRPSSDASVVEPLFVVVEPDGRLREVPLTSSPAGAERNASVVCLAGTPGRLVAILAWGDSGVGTVISANGERWQGGGAGGRLDGLLVETCHGDGDGFVLGGQDSFGRAMVAESADGERWTVTSLGETGSVLGIDQLDGERFLAGWTTAPSGTGSDGAIWRRDDTGWIRLPVDGLASDPFADSITVHGLAARDGLVVAIGRDRGRAGAWVATVDALTG